MHSTRTYGVYFSYGMDLEQFLELEFFHFDIFYLLGIDMMLVYSYLPYIIIDMLFMSVDILHMRAY